MTCLKLPHSDGRLAPYTSCASVQWPMPDAPPRWNRVAFAAAHVVYAASASDVTDVVVAGRRIVEGGEHLLVDDVGGRLARAIAAVS